MAKREQGKEIDYSSHQVKPKSMKEQQEFIVSAFPNLGTLNAKKLLESFGSIKNLVNANKEELMKIDKIGEKIASSLIKTFEEEYKKK